MSASPNETLVQLAKDLLASDPGSNHREILRIQEVLPQLPGPWQQPWMARWPNGAMRIMPAQFVRFVGQCLERGQTLDAARARLDELLATPRARGAFLNGVIGPKVELPTEIAPGLSLVSGSAYPSQHSFVDSADGIPHWVTCCIRFDAEQDQPFFEWRGEDSLPPSALPSTARSTLDEVERLLVLFSAPCPITSQGMTFVFDDDEIRTLSASGSGRYTTPGQLSRGWLQSGEASDLSGLKEAWTGLSSMAKGDRTRLGTACDRINRALLQMQFRPVDGCIEACIALEALFGGKQTESIAHKLATRCGRFLETDFEKRVERSRFVTKAYRWRSKAVHGSTSKEGVSRDDLGDLCAMIIAAARRMVCAGKIPSDEELDFGTSG